MSRKIQAVFFDMGGTIETFYYNRELRLKAIPGLQKRLVAAGIDLHLTDERLLDVIYAGMKRYHQWRLQSLQELPARQIWCKYILAGYPVDQRVLGAVAEELMVYYERTFYHRELRPEIPAVLEAIQKMGLKIGLISNVSSLGLVPANLKQYGIINYFDPIVLSSEYGRRKPDPSIFHYAARLANVPTSACVYIGDRISRDILGARRAGFQLAVQIQHHFVHGESDEGATPNAVIEDMTELLEILRVELSANPPRKFTPGQAVPPVRAIFFDAGDILYHRPSAGQILKPFLIESTGGIKPVPIEERSALNAQAFCGLINQDQLREGILRLYGITQPEIIARGKQILEEEGNDVQFFPGVHDTLIALKEAGFLLGIITDTAQPIHVKLGWFEKGGFGHIWDSIISSKEVGVCKPDPKIYHAALQQLGVSSQEAVFVGHKDYELDGAAAVGMQTVAFNYDPGAKADFYIEEFMDLLKVPVILTSTGRQEKIQ